MLSTHESETVAQQGDSPLLRVRDLSIDVRLPRAVVRVVDGVSFDVRRGACLAVVGESGSGKTMTSLAILGLHDPRRVDVTGEIALAGTDLLGMSQQEIQKVRGNRVAMVFQDALTALDPFHTVGEQIGEAYSVHTGASRKRCRARAVEVLERVGIPDPRRRADEYPHEFSGGMRQRAMIAMALACEPDVLIADEPTSALDVTVQAQIIELLEELRRDLGMAVVFVTHDLGVVARIAEHVVIMYAGRVVEQGGVNKIFGHPEHPYTAGLLRSASHPGNADTRLWTIRGAPPAAGPVAVGCTFSSRCPFASLNGDRCVDETPLLASTEHDHLVACHLPRSERRDLVTRSGEEAR